MAGEVAAIYDALVSVLQGIDGTGSYTYDLSSSVTRRAFDGRTPSTPWAYLTPSEPFAQYAVDGIAELRSYQLTLQFDLVIAVSPTDATPDSRIAAAVAAMDDVLTAIIADRSLSQAGIDVVPTLSSIDGAEVGAAAYGLCYGLIVVTALAPGGGE